MTNSTHVRGVPRPTPGPSQQVIQLGPGEALEGYVINCKIDGYGTHWNAKAGRKGRSERCTLETGECSGHEQSLPFRWKGYLYLWCLRRKEPIFLELTPAAAGYIEDVTSGELTLRGLLMNFKRGDGGAKTRLYVQLKDSSVDLTRLPEEKDPTSTLELLWGWGRKA